MWLSLSVTPRTNSSLSPEIAARIHSGCFNIQQNHVLEVSESQGNCFLSVSDSVSLNIGPADQVAQGCVFQSGSACVCLFVVFLTDSEQQLNAACLGAESLVSVPSCRLQSVSCHGGKPDLAHVWETTRCCWVKKTHAQEK